MNDNDTKGKIQLPLLDKNVNHSPHVVLLGAGASLAAFPNGDANGRKLPLMNNLIELLGLSEIFKKANISYQKNDFEAIYDDLVSEQKHQSLANEVENTIYDYFYEMTIPDTPTIYDYLILSLREKDIIASFNWDPLLLQTYRKHIKLKRLPQLAFLHGNTGTGVHYKCKSYGYVNTLCEKCRTRFDPWKLLYPVKHKDYSADSLIKEQWNKLRYKLGQAYIFTIFGYSAPVTDIDARNLLLKEWKSNPTLPLAEMEIIDIKDEEKVEKSWKEFTFSHHYGIHQDIRHSFLWRYPRRSCDAFAAANLMCNPWKDNTFQDFKTTEELHNWIKPLLKEEDRCEQSKEPFKYMVK